MSVQKSLKPVNIKRRLKRHSQIDIPPELVQRIELLSSTTSKQENYNASRALDKVINTYNRNAKRERERVQRKKQYDEILLQSQILQIEKPSKNIDTLSAQVREAKRLERRREIYLEKQTAFNSEHYPKLSQSRHIIQLMPMSDADIDQAYKILNKARAAGTSDAVLDDLRREANQDTTPAIEASRALFGSNYRTYTYFKTSVREAQNSALPALGLLFQIGGLDFVEELRVAGFTLYEYADSLSESGTSEDIIIAKLFAVYKMGNLSLRSQQLISDFVDKYK